MALRREKAGLARRETSLCPPGFSGFLEDRILEESSPGLCILRHYMRGSRIGAPPNQPWDAPRTPCAVRILMERRKEGCLNMLHSFLGPAAFTRTKVTARLESEIGWTWKAHLQLMLESGIFRTAGTPRSVRLFWHPELM